MDFRQYDPGIGRFYGLDLLAEATPNHFALNNPVISSDPTGLLTSWSEIVQMMNDFATGGGGGSMTFTSSCIRSANGGWSLMKVIAMPLELILALAKFFVMALRQTFYRYGNC